MTAPISMQDSEKEAGTVARIRHEFKNQKTFIEKCDHEMSWENKRGFLQEVFNVV